MFFSSNQSDGPIWVKQEFFRTQTPVVVDSHGEAMCPGIVYTENISYINIWKTSLNGEFIVVFTKGTAGP